MLFNYKNFHLNENLQKAKSILKKFEIPETDPNFVKLRELLKNNLGYIGKFTEWMVINKVSYEQLENLFNTINNHRLPKPIDQFKTPEEIIDLIVQTTTKADLNQMISAIPSRVREDLTWDKSEWSKFIRFLTQNRGKKNIIIDFFSKKGGRYGDRDNPVGEIIEDIKKLISMPSLESIKADSLSEANKNIKYIYDDDKYLIVAVNYQGVKKFGSSYWCITEDEYTFDDYTNACEEGEEEIQLILFDKTKNIFMDEESVMGLTIDENKRVSAAHWEDDTPATSIATKILKSLNIDYNNIYKAYSTFYEKNILFFRVPSLYVPYIESIEKCEPNERIKKFEKLFKEYYSSAFEIDNDYDKDKFHKFLFNKLKSLKIKINIDIDIAENVLWSFVMFRENIKNSIFSIAKFDDEWMESNLLTEINKMDISQIKINFLLKLFSDHVYKFKIPDKLRYSTSLLLIKSGFFTLSDLYKSIDWDYTYNDIDLSKFIDLIKFIFNNHIEFIFLNRSFRQIAIDHLYAKNHKSPRTANRSVSELTTNEKIRYEKKIFDILKNPLDYPKLFSRSEIRYAALINDFEYLIHRYKKDFNIYEYLGITKNKATRITNKLNDDYLSNPLLK